MKWFPKYFATRFARAFLVMFLVVCFLMHTNGDMRGYVAPIVAVTPHYACQWVFSHSHWHLACN